MVNKEFKDGDNFSMNKPPKLEIVLFHRHSLVGVSQQLLVYSHLQMVNKQFKHSDNLSMNKPPKLEIVLFQRHSLVEASPQLLVCSHLQMVNSLKTVTTFLRINPKT